MNFQMFEAVERRTEEQEVSCEHQLDIEKTEGLEEHYLALLFTKRHWRVNCS